MSDDEQHFDVGTSGASHTYPMQAGAVKKNGHVMLKGKPCKVVDFSTSKTGKHGHAKAHIVGLDIFTGKKYEDMCPTSHNLEVPVIKRLELQLIDVKEDGYVSLLLEDGQIKDDLQLPRDPEGTFDDVAKQIRQMFGDNKQILVTTVQACGIEKITAVKELSGQ